MESWRDRRATQPNLYGKRSGEFVGAKRRGDRGRPVAVLPPGQGSAACDAPSPRDRHQYQGVPSAVAQRVVHAVQRKKGRPSCRDRITGSVDARPDRAAQAFAAAFRCDRPR